MAQSGYTPILIYASGTATNVPLAANMTSSASGAELALNYADGKLYYKNSSGVVTLLASATTVTNSFSAGTTGFTPSTATTGAVTLAGTLVVGNGGTGQTSLATGSLGYGQGTSAHAALAIGTAGQILTVNSGATAPQWSTLSGVAVTTFSAGTTGFTPSTATTGAVTLAGTLATTNGGTGLTSFTSGGVVYASSTSALATGSALYFDGTNFGVGTGGNTLNQQSVVYKVGANAVYQQIANGSTGIGATNGVRLGVSAGGTGELYSPTALISYIDNSEQLRLNSTGLGIGTSSPVYQTQIYGSGQQTAALTDAGNKGGSLLLNTPTVAGGDGGALLIGAGGSGAKPFAAIKGLLTDGSGNTTGNLAFSIRNTTGDTALTEAMRLTSTSLYTASGINVGIGTSSPATKLHISGSTTPNLRFEQTNSSVVHQFQAASGNFFLNIDATNAIGGSTFLIQQAGSTVATLSTSGNLGLGVTPSAWSTGGAVEVGFVGSSIFGRAVNTTDYTQGVYYNAGFKYAQATYAVSLYEQQSGAHYWLIAGSGSVGSAVSFTQAMTLDTGGNLSVGRTSGGGRVNIQANSNNFMNEFFNQSGTSVGSIQTNGTITIYSTTSDYRLKTVIGGVSGAGERIDLLEPIEYEFKSDGSRTRGFLAHQFQEVYAGSVTGTKDAVNADGNPVYQAMQASTPEVIADLVAEIQSLRKRILTLENK